MASYVWRVDTPTLDEFRRLTLELGKLEKKGQTSTQLIEEVKFLPGYPTEADWVHDTIVIEWVKPVVSVSGPRPAKKGVFH